MKRFPFARRPASVCLAVLVLMLPIGTWAELPDPLDTEAATPALDYRSPLRGYRSLDDNPLHDWREANELVGRIGGWRTYAQEPWEQPTEQQAPVEPGAGGQHDHH
jgi:hypothetical protein